MGNKLGLIPKAYHDKETNWHAWQVNVPASINGRRTRKFFKSRDAAQEWADNFARKIFQGGVAAAAENTDPLSDVLEEYLTAKLPTASDREKETLARYAKVIRENLGAMEIGTVRADNVERCLLRDKKWSPRTRFNAFTYIRSFFNWAKRRGKIESNPADILSPDYPRPDGKKAILAPWEMRLLLELTKNDPVMRAFVVFGGFAGVRSEEIQRLMWNACDFKEGEIHISPEVIKKTRGIRERYIAMTDAFKRHIMASKEGKVIPIRRRGFGDLRVELAATMRSKLVELGRGADADRWSEWPDNCLRHSFASYLLADKGDAGKVAHELGHTSATMVHKAYARAVKRSAAVEWWAL